MNLLSLDSSTKTFSLALARDEHIVKVRHARLTGFLSASIIGRIDRFLKSVGWSLKNVDAFVVGLGPGSFTGLRVGLATVKGLAAGTGKPVVGIPSLDAVAYKFRPARPLYIAVMTDARRQLIYACLYRRHGKGLTRKTPYLLVPLSEFLAKINGDVFLTGDALGIYDNEIRQWMVQRTGGEVHLAAQKDWAPQAQYLVPPALERLRKKRYANIEKLEPLYLYPKECQVLRS